MVSGAGVLWPEFGHLINEKLDVHDVVDSAEVVLRLLRPLLLLFRLTCHLIRWERPLMCIFLLVFCNVFCVFLPSVYITMGVIVSIGALAALGLCHQRYRLLVKILPSVDQMRGEQSSTKLPVSHHERMQDFRLLLITFHVGLKRCIVLLNSFYSLLKWDNVRFSANCYIVLCSALLLLRALPLRFNVLLVIDVVLLSLPISRRITSWKQQSRPSSLGDLAVSCAAEKLLLDVKPELVADDAISMSSDTQLDAGIGSESDISDIEKVVEDSSSDAESVVSVSVGELAHSGIDGGGGKVPGMAVTSGRAPGVVGRILEIKKRRQQQQSNEKCTGCHVMFTTIFKRRHICSKCGFHFCSRCCSHKVPRSAFGATAPAAQTETVAVCYKCFIDLTSNMATKPKAS